MVVYILIHLQRASEIEGSCCPYMPPPHISSKLEGKRGLDMTPPRGLAVYYTMQEQVSNTNARCFKDLSLSNHLIFLLLAAAAARFLGDKLVLGRRFFPRFFGRGKKDVRAQCWNKNRLSSTTCGEEIQKISKIDKVSKDFVKAPKIHRFSATCFFDLFLPLNDLKTQLDMVHSI